MEGFDKAVNGYFDTQGQLTRYLRWRATEDFAEERKAKRSIGSRAEFEARRERVQESFLASIGGLPDRPADPEIETTDVSEREGYAVELLAFESLSGFHVTANCYVPEGDGPHPGVLFLCGHVRAAKADPLNQKACIELALNGFVVLVVDPICQGEREQYRDAETGEPSVSSAGGAFAHCYAGQQCFYAGANLARYMIHDARCALDYLEKRADVDGDRIGVTGTSGGGVQTTYLALLDDRIDAAAPCCAITEREEWLKTGKRIDAEQAIHGAIPQGINYDDLLTAMASRPVCIGAAASDEYFPIEGVHETTERTREVYDLYGAAGNVGLVVAETTHCFVYELGDGIFEWFCEVLSDADYVPNEDLSVVEGTALHCTPDGSVREAYADERTIDDLVREYVLGNSPDAGTAPAVESPEQQTGRVRRTVIETFDLDRPDCELHPRYVAESESEGLTTEHVFFKAERNPDVVLTGVLVSDPDVSTGPPAVVLYEQGAEELPERSEAVASLAAEYGTVLVFDPRGVGAVRNRPIPIPSWVEEYNGIYGTEFKLAYDALLLGTSLFGMRVYDVLRAIEFLRSATGCEGVALVGETVGASHALYAGVVDRGVGTIGCRDLGPSFHGMATTREYPFDPRLTVSGVIGECDVPHLLVALDDRDLRVERTTD